MSAATDRMIMLAAAFAALAAAADGMAAPPQPQPFAAGDDAAGKVLVVKDCIDCHARRFNGDADRMYLRPERKVRTPAQLMAQIQMCNTQLGTGYFPEEEAHVAAYLNLHYYQFKP